MRYKQGHKAYKLIFSVNYLFLMKTCLKTDKARDTPQLFKNVHSFHKVMDFIPRTL